MQLVNAARPLGHPSTPPQIGNLVRARDRLWVVGEVQRSTVEPDLLARHGQRVDHLVQLASIEDDGFGDEIRVVWEVEPGTQVIERPGLPDPSAGEFDAPQRLKAFLDAVRWGAITSADAEALQAPFRAGIELEDYQLAPLVKALSMPRANLLIADDVGLGKTIEAGLVVQELLLRHRARSVMVLCPPGLCVKWQGEMAERFGLDFRILDSSMVKQLRRERGFGVNPFTHYPRLIASLDWVKLEAQRALLAEILPPDANSYPRRFDLLIVDEIHTCAPPAVGRYAIDSQRTKLIRYLAPHFEHRLFLSATPHNGYPESFQGLLELLDRQRFAKGLEPSPEALGQVMVRRLKSELAAEAGPRPDGSPRFPRREIHAISVDYPEEESQIHRALERYRDAMATVARGNALAESATRFVTLLLKKRLLSSPAAFASTLEQHRRTLNHKAAEARGPMGVRALQASFARLEDDMGDEAELEEATVEALAVANRATDTVPETAIAALAEMQVWASSNKGRPDAKTSALLAWLDATCRPGGAWNAERVIVFTEFRTTLEYLRTLMTMRGLGKERLAIIHGGIDQRERQDVVERFQYDPAVTPVRILLATDAASEGIDLQRFCHRIVHVEIPFSPTRLEQRNGRVDRHGQPSPVVDIYHMVGRDPGQGPAAADTDFLLRVARKVEQIRSGLGSANPVLERQIEEAMLGQRRSLDEGLVDRSAQPAALSLKRMELSLRREVAALRAKLDASVIDLGIAPAAVEAVVAVGLELGRQLPLQPMQHGQGGHVFRVPDLTGSWAGALRGLSDPITLGRRPVTFDAELARRRTDMVHLHLGHPLVLRAMRLLRAQVWAAGGDARLTRVTACVSSVPCLTVIAHARVVITGADGGRLHEEVVAAAGQWTGGRLQRLGVSESKGALGQVTDQAAPRHVCQLLAEQWDAMRAAVKAALDARATEIGVQRTRRLDARRDQEQASIAKVLSDLETSIRGQLEDLARKPEVMQLRLAGLGNDDERRQLERDLGALQRRVEEIPDEIIRERERIATRYATRDVRTFPVAITFLVPASLGAGR